jgi:hypothetical protein
VTFNVTTAAQGGENVCKAFRFRISTPAEATMFYGTHAETLLSSSIRNPAKETTAAIQRETQPARYCERREQLLLRVVVALLAS